MSVEIDLSGKVAVVTGGAGGIGSAAVERLTEAGAHCIVLDFKNVDVPVDVSDDAQVEQFFRDLGFVQPKLDILVTCAGITADGKMAEMTAVDFRKVLNVNLTGTFNCIQQAVKLMHEGGSIVTISSISAAGNYGQANYAASKAGVQALTSTAAIEYGKAGIRVNAIAPGPVPTEMLKTVPESVLEGWIKSTPLRKLTATEDIANTALFLASDLSSHVTGQVLTVSGGLRF